MNVCAELFTNSLDSKGLTYRSRVDEDGDTIVDFPIHGKVVKLIFSGDDTYYLSLYIQFENVPEEKYADAIFACNELNVRYKWATFYVDSDRDVMIHDDAILAVENAADEAFELLLRLIKISDDAKPMIMKALYA